MPNTATASRPVAPPSVQGLPHGEHSARAAGDAPDASRRVQPASLAQYERLLRLRDVLDIVGLSRAHVYNLIKQGLFPSPIALGSNCARWVQSDVLAWVEASIAAARLTAAERRSVRMGLQ